MLKKVFFVLKSFDFFITPKFHISLILLYVCVLKALLMSYFSNAYTLIVVVISCYYGNVNATGWENDERDFYQDSAFILFSFICNF